MLVIRSKLDYASPFYSSASSSQVQKLEKFQNKCIRFIIGVLNSTPTPALGTETRIMPLQYCRNYLTDRCFARSLTQTSSVLHPQLLNISSNWRFAHSRLPLLCKRAELILRLKPFTPQPHPIHRQAHLPFHQIFQKATLHVLQKSKTMSIFHAEQVAIYQILLFIKENFTVGHLLIISDSLSALQSITNSPIKAKSLLSLLIITLLISLSRVIVEFLWAPSHVGITHNETVDRLEKQASISGSPSNILPLSEIYPIIRHSTYDDWNIHYAESFSNQNS